MSLNPKFPSSEPLNPEPEVPNPEPLNPKPETQEEMVKFLVTPNQTILGAAIAALGRGGADSGIRVKGFLQCKGCYNWIPMRGSYDSGHRVLERQLGG